MGTNIELYVEFEDSTKPEEADKIMRKFLESLDIDSLLLIKECKTTQTVFEATKDAPN